ncbi:hypothetical protein B0H13DRAFT_1926870 [Mycena leptocephala]|nr:hypothetical protein B0H13DRAFT_1926870 [Mycena leptocephala]
MTFLNPTGRAKYSYARSWTKPSKCSNGQWESAGKQGIQNDPAEFSGLSFYCFSSEARGFCSAGWPLRSQMESKASKMTLLNFWAEFCMPASHGTALVPRHAISTRHFIRKGNYINLARINPGILEAICPLYGNKMQKWVLGIDGKTARATLSPSLSPPLPTTYPCLGQYSSIPMEQPPPASEPESAVAVAQRPQEQE